MSLQNKNGRIFFLLNLCSYLLSNDQIFLIHYSTYYFWWFPVFLYDYRIRGWWVIHHYLSVVLSAILLIWPESTTYQLFRNKFMIFSLYLCKYKQQHYNKKYYQSSLKGLSVIVNSKLHIFPNPVIFLHIQSELITYLYNNSPGNSIFLERETIFLLLGMNCRRR